MPEGVGAHAQARGVCTCMCRCVTVKAAVLRTYSHDVLPPAAGAKVTRSGGGSNSRNISSLLPHQPLHVQLLLRDRGRCLCWPVPPAVPVSVAVGGGGAVGRHGRGRRALHGSQSKGRQGLVALERKCLVPTGGARRLASWGGSRCLLGCGVPACSPHLFVLQDPQRAWISQDCFWSHFTYGNLGRVQRGQRREMFQINKEL